MRTRTFTSIAIVVALTVSASVLGQDRERGRGGRGFGRGGFGFGGFSRTIDKATLLGSAQVREELKVKEDQGKKLDEILAAHREASREIFSSLRESFQEDREKARQEMTKKREALDKKTEKKLVAVLEKSQVKRLDEISLQQQGIDGIVSAPVVAALKLDEGQVGKIKTALATRDEEIGKLTAGFRRGPRGEGRGAGRGEGRGERPNFEEIREKREKITADAEKAVLGFLRKEQTEALAKLKGKPFELDRRSLFRGRGGFGGGREGGGRGGRGGARGGQRQRPPVDDDSGTDL